MGGDSSLDLHVFCIVVQHTLSALLRLSVCLLNHRLDRDWETILLRDNIKPSDRVSDADGVAWVNENGLSLNLARNWRATELISNMFEGASFVGDVLFEIYNEDMYKFLKTMSRRSRWKNYLVR